MTCLEVVEGKILIEIKVLFALVEIDKNSNIEINLMMNLVLKYYFRALWLSKWIRKTAT